MRRGASVRGKSSAESDCGNNPSVSLRDPPFTQGRLWCVRSQEVFSKLVLRQGNDTQVVPYDLFSIIYYPLFLP